MSKTIVITGASRGIGFETALQLCKLKHKVVAIARTGSGLESLYNEARNFGCSDNLVTLQGDLSSQEGTTGIVNRIIEVTPVIDVLINNAGTLTNKSFQDTSLIDLQRIYMVNVFAPFLLSQNLLGLLRKSTAPHIVNIGSIGGVNGTSKFPGLSAYSSSKGAIGILSELLAEELKSDNISVNCLALGSVQTEMLEHAFPGFKASVSAKSMGEYIAWFALNGMNFFNGKVIPVALSTP